jgi:hypothetical protein
MLDQIRIPKPPKRAAATSSTSAIARTKRVEREDNASGVHAGLSPGLIDAIHRVRADPVEASGPAEERREDREHLASGAGR